MQNNSSVGTIFQTDSSKGTSDLLVLKYMRQRVRLTLSQLEPCAELQRPLVYNFQERHGRFHRIALYQCQELLHRPNLAFVGFISKKQPDIHPSYVDEVHSIDGMLVAELADNTGMLSYSSLELRTGIWCNLVVMADTGAKQQLLSSKTHAHAAYKLAPHYYEWIRLHNGAMLHGLFRDDMKVLYTRHYTFSQDQKFLADWKS